MKTEQVTAENIFKLRDLYREFSLAALSDYYFELPPLGFEDFVANFRENFIKAYVCTDDEPVGFLLYSDILTQSLEITLSYAKDNNRDIHLELLKKFLEDAKTTYPNKVVSYPLLGIQNDLTPDITNLGFSPIGEAILELDFRNPVSFTILEKANLKPKEESYSIVPWKNEYTQTAANIVFEEFSKMNDAKFDTRFTNLTGTLDIINSITRGLYGEFLNNATSVLTYNDIPVGFCFVNLSAPEIANIPLLVISQEHTKKGLGAILLKRSVDMVKNEILSGSNIKILNTTCDTENFGALKTYRKIGFKEKTYYTHSYMKL